MATTHQTGGFHETRFNEDNYPVFKKSFDPKTRHDLVDDDMIAGKSVVGILSALVILGLIVGVIGLLMAPGY